jgi:hypothetical protein
MSETGFEAQPLYPRPVTDGVYVHLIREYARHAGHADILREQIDGVTGD